ncbi:PH domain-containing protein [Nocardioides ferulae]|uniref:PH domain-containing protein n=1 Tax=Nocardioides ferulae TaxID=2340821 RepID=UPI000F89559D|nr:PH domain-containing protein [Nocardioides ferulae]
MTGPPVTEPPAGLAQEHDWQRLDPRMLLVHPVLEVVKFLPVLLGVLVAGTATGTLTWELFGLGFPVALGLLRYLTTSFRIADGRVELKRGLLNRSTLSARLDRVRTVDLSASLVHRLLGLQTLRIGTGSTSTDEDDRLDLDGLPTERALRLRGELLRAGAGHAEPSAAGPGVGTAAGPVSAPPPALTLDLGWVRYAPLTGTGAVVFAGLLGAVGQVVSSVGEVRVDTTRIESGPGLPGALLVAALGVGVLVVYVAFSVAGYLVANWGFALRREAGSWHVRRGLLTTRETSIDEERVAGVTLTEPWPLRLAGAARVSAIVTGLATASNSAALAPPAPRVVAQRVGSLVLGSAEPLVGGLVAHGPVARQRRWFRALAPALLVVGAASLAVPLLDAPGWVPLVALLALPVGVALAVDRTRSLGHAVVGDTLVARSGSLLRRREALGVEHVIGWNLRATWFQRRGGLTSLSATTAGGRQSVTVLDVPDDEAVRVASDAVPGLVEQFLADAR